MIVSLPLYIQVQLILFWDHIGVVNWTSVSSKLDSALQGVGTYWLPLATVTLWLWWAGLVLLCMENCLFEP